MCVRPATKVKAWKRDKDEVICEVVLADGKVQSDVNLKGLPVGLQWLVKGADEKGKTDSQPDIGWLVHMQNLPSEKKMEKEVKVCPLMSRFPLWFSPEMA